MRHAEALGVEWHSWRPLAAAFAPELPDIDEILRQETHLNAAGRHALAQRIASVWPSTASTIDDPRRVPVEGGSAVANVSDIAPDLAGAAKAAALELKETYSFALEIPDAIPDEYPPDYREATVEEVAAIILRHCAPAAVGEGARPPIGSKVQTSPPMGVIEVTEHTERGFKYKGAIPLSIPRMGIQGDGTGEIFLDVPGVSWTLAPRPSAERTDGERPQKHYEGSSGISCKQRDYTYEELAEFLRLYNELIYEVASVTPGESRHETAKRYIHERETTVSGPAHSPARTGQPPKAL